MTTSQDATRYEVTAADLTEYINTPRSAIQGLQSIADRAYHLGYNEGRLVGYQSGRADATNAIDVAEITRAAKYDAMQEVFGKNGGLFTRHEFCGSHAEKFLAKYAPTPAWREWTRPSGCKFRTRDGAVWEQEVAGEWRYVRNDHAFALPPINTHADARSLVAFVDAHWPQDGAK